MKKQSVKSTYDSRKTGYAYHIGSTVNGKTVADKDIADPFVYHTIHISLLDVLKGLIKGGITVCVNIRGKNLEIEEDVLELDDNYLSNTRTRRDEFHDKMFKQLDREMTMN